MKVGIGIKPGEPRARKLAMELYHWLIKHDQKVWIAEPCLMDQEDLPRLPLEKMPQSVELMIVLGGDGTLLHVARRFIGSSTPIMGINLGRLGFLTETPVGGMFDAVEHVLEGKSKIERRFGLQVEAWRDRQRFTTGCAINDVVLQRNEHPRMIEFEMWVQKQFVFRLRGDGLVLATPAGSTAYALSAGGPIVHPRLPAISVVPICPHILSNRPIVVPAEDVVELKVTESPAPVALNLDGQEHSILEQGDRIRVEKAGYVSLVYLPGRNYYQVLRSKLHWGGPE
jgi:NAD+ kinase